MTPLDEADIHTLQLLLDKLPSPLEPLDVSLLDGFLCAVLLQPSHLPPTQWMNFIADSEEGRAPPANYDMSALHSLVMRRHDELHQAIEHRCWFDPWVFELEADALPAECVYPWVAGFAIGAKNFPALMRADTPELREPLVLLYRYLNADDLEDADELFDEISLLEPPADLAEAVQDLVRATLLWADVTRPLVGPGGRAGVPAGAGQPRKVARKPRR